MPHSLLDRQLATIKDTLRECDQHGKSLRGVANKRAEVTPGICDEESENAASITAGPSHKDLERTISISQSEGMHTKQHAPPSGRDIEDMNDPQRMLRELEHDSQERSDRHTEKEHAEFDTSKPAEMSGLATTTDQYGTIGDNPKELLQELNRRYWAAKGLGTGHNETGQLIGSKAMLADTKGERQTLGLNAYQGTECDDETALEGSTITHLPLRSLAPQHTLRSNGPMPTSYGATSCRPSERSMANALDPETTSYALALMLESAGCKWEEVKGWTLFLFSKGMEEYRAKQEREQRSQEEERLGAVIAYALEVEEKRRAVEKCQLATRLIVSNLAADADRTSIYHFFDKYQKDIRNITLLPERDPVRRTRTAYVDMYSRKAAVRASFEFGDIFGLVVKIKLAVE